MKKTHHIGQLESMNDLKAEMIDFQKDIISIPAIGPKSGGDGELKKAEFIQDSLTSFGFNKISRYDAFDKHVSSGIRPNMITWIPGIKERRLIVVTHLDTVPPGPLTDWKTDPFTAVIENGRIYGRGSEDNGQSLTASVFAAKRLLDEKIRPEYTIGLAMVSDEEAESEMGIKHLIKDGVFRKEDLILVPDHGTPDGRLIEICEKSIAWIKIRVKGKQCHASMPDLGINAHRASLRFGSLVDEALSREFDKTDDLFDRPYSTFEPTRKEENVPNINTVPGEDIFYFDCRLIPPYETSQIMDVMRTVANDVEKDTGTKIEFEVVLNESAPAPTSPEAKIVKMMLKAVEEIKQNKPYVGGIGGGTCASYFRNAGLPAVVWETCDNKAHAPNEYCIIDNMVDDTKVFASLFIGK
jgi:succinyl-diaminopimelate desuccinylase